ncbi:GNAT family N-acetyltransferase [Streptomyces clavuligerus]|uniref:GNAT family N-acetyltransferase n=1 Tax=Streptomyces clavuligerus TaxID=1901 RepID=UPI00017FF9C5|nr:GNAT family protein [Streptomyces clavuligerus]EDY50435.1 acetyltransferase [Streptomyces clavuligerus]QCS09558.1 N-acetyltransferase [Streptomyces clavuligerus]QPJ98389.1 GNAT family N-acetyltransferase [Streptomyces clavuligerus]WDN56282.1 GNAT family N-acetyltransferase [Streptomyces clavuligerus]
MVDHVRDASRPDFLSKPSLGGEQVLLRPVTADDVPALMPMLMDAETSRLTGSHDDGALDEGRIHAWYDSRRQQDDRLDLAVVDLATGSVVGEAVLNGWDPGNESCSFRICLVPGTYGSGLGTEATRLTVGYGFEKLGLHRISLEVYAFNPRARRAYEKAGFVAEGVLRDALLWEGERVDATVMSILAPEWFQHGGRPAATGHTAG